MTNLLSGKTALVTGGSRGIGAATARKLAAQGASVAITYGASRDQAEAVVKEIAAAGGKALALKGDALAPETLPALIGQVMNAFGGLDILVNNAGIFTGGSIGEMEFSDYEAVRNVNIDSVFTLTNEAVKVMKKGGRIITISSCLGLHAGSGGISNYIASKFAVIGFTRGWSRDLGPKGILVNAVLPGPINTDMNPETSDYADEQRKVIALGRYGQPEEVAAAVAFLAGPDATFITGATLSVDGGWGA